MFGGIATGIAGAAVGAICIAGGNLAFIVIGAAPAAVLRPFNVAIPSGPADPNLQASTAQELFGTGGDWWL